MTPKKNVERFNRARDFFGDPVKRWSNMLTPERSIVEEYRRARVAIILECELIPSNVKSVNIERDSTTHVFPKGEEAIDLHHGTFLVLKAHTANFEKLGHWDEKLVFIDDIQLVKGTDGEIASLVGLYRFQYVLENITGDLLLFESRKKGGFQFFPRIADWKSRVLAGVGANLEIQNVEGAPQVMERIAQQQGQPLVGEWLDYDQAYISGLSVLLDAKRIKVRGEPSANCQIEITDVLIGPYNL